MSCAGAALGMNMPSWRSRRSVCVGIVRRSVFQVRKTEGLTDRGFRAVPPLDPALCAVFGVKLGLSDRWPTPKDQLTAKLTDRAHQCMMQQEAVMNNIALLSHNMAADPHRLAEQAVNVTKTTRAAALHSRLPSPP